MQSRRPGQQPPPGPRTHSGVLRKALGLVQGSVAPGQPLPLASGLARSRPPPLASSWRSSKHWNETYSPFQAEGRLDARPAQGCEAVPDLCPRGGRESARGDPPAKTAAFIALHRLHPAHLCQWLAGAKLEFLAALPMQILPQPLPGTACGSFSMQSRAGLAPEQQSFLTQGEGFASHSQGFPIAQPCTGSSQQWL